MAASQQSKVVSISKSPNNDRIAAPRSTAPQPSAPNSYAVTALADITDRSLHAATARFTGGMSPAAWRKPIWIGRHISPTRLASGCSSRTRRYAKAYGS